MNGRGQFQTFPNGGPDTISQGCVPAIHDQPTHYQGAQYQYLSNGPPGGQGPSQHYPLVGSPHVQLTPYNNPQGGPPQRQGQPQQYSQGGPLQGQDSSAPHQRLGPSPPYPHQGQGPLQPYPQGGPHQGYGPAQPYPQGGPHQGYGPAQPYPQGGPHQGYGPAQPYPQGGPHQGYGPAQPYPQGGPHQGYGPAQPYPQGGPHQGYGPTQPYSQVGPHQGYGPAQPYPQRGSHQGQGPPQPYPQVAPHQGQYPPQTYPQDGSSQGQNPKLNYQPNGPPLPPSTKYYLKEEGHAQSNQCIGQSPPTSMPSHGNDPVDSATSRSDSGETDMEVDEDLYGHGNEANLKLPSRGNQHGNGLTQTETPQHSKKDDPMTEHDKYYPDRFFVSGLNNKIREETLSDFVEVCSAYEVDKIEYSLDMSKAVVTLKLDMEQKLDTEDWSRLKSGIVKRPLEGSRIVFKRLPLSNKICVWNFHRDHPNLPFQDYFEHPKSGNKANSAVDVKLQDGFTIVTFENFSVRDCVLSHKPHTLSGHNLVVTAFYDDLGPVKQAAPQTREETFRFLSKGEGMLMSRLVDSLKSAYNLQEVTTKGLEVKLKGDHYAVASGIEKLFSNQSEIKQKEVKCSNLKAEYLNSNDGRKEMIAILDRKGILASWICHPASITIYASSERDVSVTVSTIENDLKEGDLVAGRHFDALKDHLEHNFDKGKYLLCRKNNLWFLAHKDIFSDVKSEIDSFLRQKKPKETLHVSLSAEEYRFFQIVMPMSRIRDDLRRRYDVEIQDSGTGLSVYGHEKNVRQACDDLKSQIKRDELSLDSKESERFQKVGNHGILFKHIEDTKNCVVKMEQKTVTFTGEDEDLGAVGGSYGSKTESYGSKKRLYGSDKGSRGSDGYFYRKEKPDTGDNERKPKKSKRANRKFVPHGSTGETQLKITLVEGEIAKTDAEVGVNVVTKSFDMDFGAISKSFKKEGGHALEKECNRYKIKGYQINEGSFIRTSGGDLKCKHVIHCCIPLRSDSKCDQIYKELVKDMLKEADKDLQCKSIALPALGTGVFHSFDASWVADTLYNSVTDFEKQELPKYLKEVKFVVYPKNKDVVKAFRDKDKKWKASQADTFGSSAKTHGSSVTFPKVSVISGELAKQETEVIVNTSNASLELSRGAVSKSILDIAGSSIQTECTKWRNSKGSVHPGHFAVTGAGNMKGTKKLYHCHLPHYKHDAIKLLESMLMEILRTAEKYKTKDIAFPALGTGGLKYPPKEVAHAFFKVVHAFGLTHPDSTLKEIQLVVYAADTHVLQTFRDEEKLFLKKCLESASSTPAEPSPDYEDRANSFSTPEDDGPIIKVAFGRFIVTVKNGDISEERNTCIVNPINSNMSLKTGSVSKALARVGGKEFEKKTGQADYILKDEHVAFVDLTKDTGVMHLDRQYLEKKPVDAIACCLKISKLHKFTSISFPILLTGDAAEKMAADLYSALLMLDPMASKTVQDVSVVIYDKSQADVFCRKFESLKGGPTKKSRVETQFVLQLYSDTYSRLEDGKKTLKAYAGDREITDVVNLLKNVPRTEISRSLRDHDVNVTSLNHGRFEVKGKPAEVLKALAVLKTFIAYKNDDEIDDHALFGDGKETQNMDYERESSMKHSLSSSTKTGYGGVGKPAFAGSLNKDKGYEDTTSEEFYSENGTKSSGSMDQEKKGYKYPSEVELENDSRFKTPTKGTEASAEASNSWSMSTEEDIPAAPYKMTWSFLDPDSEDLNEYGEDLSRQIEKAYRKGEMQFKLPPDEDGSEYIIDFKTMVEYPKTNPGDVVPVLRREEVKSSMPNLPSTWYAMDGQDQMITLKTSDGPFEKVKEHLENTRQGQPVFLVKIEKVQNKEVYGRYQWKKKTMKDTDGPMERLLWHPCVSTDSIVPINKHGMNLHFCQPTSEGPLGEGIEFFENFTDIVQPTADKNQYAYLCNVLVGKYTKGQRGIRDPPSGESDESDFYHSVVDDVAKPSKYLIFSDTQVEPQYLVTYKLEKTGGNKN